MAKPAIEPGAVIDGFAVGERLHVGGMAALWSASYPGIDVPLLMKVPLTSEGEDPAAIVSFEMEQMILPRLSGPHVPLCFGTGDFARQAYVVMNDVLPVQIGERGRDLAAEHPHLFVRQRQRVEPGEQRLAGDALHHDMSLPREIAGAETQRHVRSR